MLADIPAEQVQHALEEVARQVLAQSAIDQPPINARLLARRLGMIVARDSLVGVRARFVRLGGRNDDGQPAILVADDVRPERQHWAVAHEIGEGHAHCVFERLGVDPLDAPPGAREAVANRLAGCLLLPRAWFLADGAATEWDVCALKACYATASHELIARRMIEMPPPVIISLWDQDKLQWRRSNIGGKAPPVAPSERDARRAAFERGLPARCDPCELPDGVEDVRAWPVHEPGWRREIVRTQLADPW